MISYQQLDTIADSYTPILGAIWLLLALAPLVRLQLKTSVNRVVSGLLASAIAYGGMYADNHWLIWPRYGLDYSTHTAIAIAAVVQLMVIARQGWWLWSGSLLAYLMLMNYQHYHSWADMVTTGLAVLPPMLLTTLWQLGRGADERNGPQPNSEHGHNH